MGALPVELAILEIADVLGALVLDANEADPLWRAGDRLAGVVVRHLLHRRLGIPGEELGNRLVDKRPKRLGARLMAPHQSLVAGVDDSRKLPLPAAAGQREDRRGASMDEERATQHGTAPAEERVGRAALGGGRR